MQTQTSKVEFEDWFLDSGLSKDFYDVTDKYKMDLGQLSIMLYWLKMAFDAGKENRD